MHAIVIFTKIEGFSQYCLQRNFIKNKNFKNTIESYFNFTDCFEVNYKYNIDIRKRKIKKFFINNLINKREQNIFKKFLLFFFPFFLKVQADFNKRGTNLEKERRTCVKKTRGEVEGGESVRYIQTRPRRCQACR